VFLKRSDEQLEASRDRGRFRRKVLVVQTNDVWIVEHPNDITRRPDGCKGTVLTTLNSAQILL
jgi:hypothetical protein